MRIESNIGAVVGRLQRLQEAIPAAQAAIAKPEAWLEEAQATAQRVLLAIALPPERGAIPDFVKTITAGLLENGFTLRMGNPYGDAHTVQSAAAARAAVSPRDLAGNLFLGQLQQFEDLLVEWVETEKDKDARDAGKTDEEIANLISYILLTSQPTLAVARARMALLPHIEKFIARKQSPVAPATITVWLKTVLAAWRELVRLKAPEKFRTEMNRRLEELF